MLFKFLMKSPKAEQYEFLLNYSSTVCLSSVFLHLIHSFIPYFFFSLSLSFFLWQESWNFLDLSKSNSILNGNSLQMVMYNTSGNYFRWNEEEREHRVNIHSAQSRR